MAEQPDLHDNKQPLISIITVTYNAEKHIRECLDSVLKQSYSNLELIVIDGNSTDRTTNIVEGYGNKVDYFISEEDGGIYDAMNKGIKVAGGDIIGMLNADDYYLEGTLSKVAHAFLSSGKDIVYGNMKKQKEIRGKLYHRLELPNLEMMEENMGIFHPATFVKREVFEKIGTFDTQFSLSADYEFFLRAWKKSISFHYLNEVLTVFRTGGESSLNCNSYREGLKILQRYDSPHAGEMKALISKCKRKKALNKIINTLAHIPGMRRLMERRLIRKWKK